MPADRTFDVLFLLGRTTAVATLAPKKTNMTTVNSALQPLSEETWMDESVTTRRETIGAIGIALRNRNDAKAAPQQRRGADGAQNPVGSSTRFHRGSLSKSGPYETNAACSLDARYSTADCCSRRAAKMK